MNVQLTPKLSNEPVKILLFKSLIPIYSRSSLLATLERKLRGVGMNMEELNHLTDNIRRGNFKVVNGSMYINGKLVETPVTHIHWDIAGN